DMIGERLVLSWAWMKYIFFFSSRRRHTRFSRDWSSDVCSSDLPEVPNFDTRGYGTKLEVGMVLAIEPMAALGSGEARQLKDDSRSEERRVGKEGRDQGERCESGETTGRVRGHRSPREERQTCQV